MTHKDLIDKLGGAKVLAEAFGLAANVVGNWRIRDRVPGEYKPAVAEMARRRRIKLPAGFLAPSPRRKAA